MKWLSLYQSEVEKNLKEIVGHYTELNSESSEATLQNACRYAVMGKGKRIRPILALLCYELGDLNQSRKKIIKICNSLELIHAYSLVHDDLPAMDNDELRRGKMTVWKKYSEATAILAGDWLISMAFENIIDQNNTACTQKLIKELAKLIGGQGMIGGQVRDIYFETHDFSLEELIRTHQMKTGALIQCSAQFGAILGNLNTQKTTQVINYAEKIGLAFQIKDDLLDYEGIASVVGKPVRKDIHEKGFIKCIGIEKTRIMLQENIDEAICIAQDLGSEKLVDLARFIGERDL